MYGELDVYSSIKYAVPNKKLWMYIEYAEKTQYDDAVFQWTVLPLPFMRSDQDIQADFLFQMSSVKNLRQTHPGPLYKRTTFCYTSSE